MLRTRQGRVRWGGVIAAAVLGLLALAAVLVHTPFAQRAVLSRLSAEAAAMGMRLDARRLSYNLFLFSPSATLEGVTLSASAAGTPFLQADTVRAALPWSAVWGAFAIESLEIDRPRLVIVRDAAGADNLPVFARSQGAPAPISIGRLVVRDLDVRYTDASSGTAVTASGLTLDLSRQGILPLAGTLKMSVPATLRIGERVTSVTSLAGRLAFDGTTLALAALDAEAPELRAHLSGRVDLLSASPSVAIRYEVHADAERVAPWLGLKSPVPRGVLSLSGAVDGLLTAPVLQVDLATDRLVWPPLGAVSLSSRARLTRSEAIVESFRATVAGGEVAGSGRVRFDATATSSVHATWRDLSLRALAQAVPDLPVRVASAVSGEGAIDWTNEDMTTARGHATATFRAPASARDALPLAGQLDLALGQGRWTLRADQRVAEIGSAAATVTGRLAGDLWATPLAGQVQLEIEDVRRAASGLAAAGYRLPDAIADRMRGSAAIRADVGGTFAAPRASGTLRVADGWFDRTGPGIATADFNLTKTRLLVDALEVSVGPNVISGHGDMRLTSGALTGHVTATLPRLDLFAESLPADWRIEGAARLDAELGGTAGHPHFDGQLVAGGVRVTNAALSIDARGDAEIRGQGTIESPQLAGVVDLSELTWNDYRLGAVRGDIAIANGRANVRADVPAARATVVSAVALSSRTFTLEAALNGADLSSLVRPSGPAGNDDASTRQVDVRGTVTAAAAASGDLKDLAGATAELDLRVADAAVDGVDFRLDRPVRLRYEQHQLVAEDVALGLGASRLSASGRLGVGTFAGEGLDVALAGSLSDFVPFIRLAPAARRVDASGAVDLRVRAAGSTDAPEISGTLSVSGASFSAEGLPAVSGVIVRAAYAGGVLQLDDARGAWQGADLAASGQSPLAVLGDLVPERYRRSLPPNPSPARVQIRITSITPSVLSPWLDRETLARLDGRIDVSATLEAASLDPSHVTGSVILDRAELSFAQVPIAQTEPTRLRLANGRLEVVQWSWAGAGNQLDVVGGISLTGEPALALGATGSLDLRMIGAFVPDVAASGRAALNVRAAGPAGHPDLSGEVSIAGADVILRSPRLAMTDLRATATLSKNSVRLRDLSANANGGTVEADGTIEYQGTTVTGGTLSIRGRGLALEIPEHLRTEVDADLTLARGPGRDAPSLTGRVTILRGMYRQPVSLTEQLLTGRASGLVVAVDSEPGPFDNVELGIAVVTAEDLVVDNNYARAEVGGNLRLTGTVGQPAMSGRLTTREGSQVFLGGRTYEVQRGTVDFTSPTRIEPNVDLALNTRVQDYDTTLEISGTPDALDVSLRSPGQSQEDVVSLLLTGQLASESTVAQSTVARGQLLMLLSGEFLGFAGRAVGLDSVQVSRGLGGAASDFDLLATNTDPSARLTVAKHLSRNVELIFSQSLRESGDITWVGSYRPGHDVELRLTSRDDKSRAYEFRHELTFVRAGDVVGAPTAPPAPERPRVAGVAFVGSPGFSEAELERIVRLHAGDRFDFYRWQRDRDRLIAWYHDRGFLEVHVTARRRDAEAGSAERSLVLEYGVERGPPTTLTVVGYALSGDVLARMKEAWEQAVFDGFLLDDLKTLALAALIGDGYLQSEVTAVVSPAPASGDKEIVIRIDPRQRFAERGLVFAGNEHVSADELRAAVETPALEVDAWLNPAALKLPLERFYRARGYQAVVVTPGEPTFVGQQATLPIRVEEGVRFETGDVAVQGTAALTADEVRVLFDLERGAPYLPSAVEPARRRVESEYLRRAYNDVRVSVASAIDRDRARVDITLTIDEGSQQVLSDVEVRGAGITNRGVIDRAVDLEPGDPADLVQVYRAQKRLYDTGVFQNADVTIQPAGGQEPAPAAGVQPVQAVVILQELPRYRFRYGFRLNDEVAPAEATREVRPALVADLLRRNLFGRALSAGLAGQIEADRRLARGYLSLPTMFGRAIVTNLFATTSRQHFAPESEFDLDLVERVSEFTLEQRFRPARSMSATYGYSFARKHSFEPHPDPESFLPPHDVSTDIARLTSTYAWDTRDDPSNAHRGWFHSSGLEFGSLALGSDLRFIKYLAQEYYFQSVGGGVVLASGFRLGAGRGFGGQDLSEKFHAGGGTTVRGFAEGGLGEVDFFGPVGGNALLVLNQEVRFPIYRWVRGVGFIDAGNVFSAAGDLSFRRLDAGTGVGLRLDSPFVLLRLDFGVPLTRRAQEPSGRWYIGIGHTF